jgi:hypothetical protein
MTDIIHVSIDPSETKLIILESILDALDNTNVAWLQSPMINGITLQLAYPTDDQPELPLQDMCHALQQLGFPLKAENFMDCFKVVALFFSSQEAHWIFQFTLLIQLAPDVHYSSAEVHLSWLKTILVKVIQHRFKLGRKFQVIILWEIMQRCLCPSLIIHYLADSLLISAGFTETVIVLCEMLETNLYLGYFLINLLENIQKDGIYST